MIHHLDRLKQLVAEHTPATVALRHDIHAHPELGFEEHRTAGLVSDALTELGIEHLTGVGGTGVVAHLPGGDGPPVALRADMDALPMAETSGVAWASQTPGCMHACGHDGHTSILVGTARILAALRDEVGLPRPVTLIFQPAEEGGGGGRVLVEAGALDGRLLGPSVAEAFALHGWPLHDLGKVGSRPGPLLAAVDRWEIELTGVGGHAAIPHQSRDVIVCASALVSALQQVASRNVAPTDSVVLSVTQLHAGTSHNILPEKALLAGTARTLSAQTRDLVEARFREIVAGVCAAHRCEARITYDRGYPVTLNDPALVEQVAPLVKEALGQEVWFEPPHPVMGGEDFSYYGEQVPAVFFMLGTRPPGRTDYPGVHHPDYDFNDEAVSLGLTLMASLALRG